MPRLINPVGWKVTRWSSENIAEPLLSLENDKGHCFHIHGIEGGLVRVVHTLPLGADQTWGLRNHRRTEAGVDGIKWERRRVKWDVSVDKVHNSAQLSLSSGRMRPRIEIDYSHTIKLSWFLDTECSSSKDPFLMDFKSAYTYDTKSGRVNHLVCRDKYMPLSEHAKSANDNHPAHPNQVEFIYGLGETKGPMMKRGKRYVIDARDSLGADPEETDPLYKLCPYYSVFNAQSRLWYGMYYNTLSPSVFDFGAEHDFSTGDFRSFSSEHGPLDYYVLLGADRDAIQPTLPAITSQLARLVTPYCSGVAGRVAENSGGNAKLGWQASPTLPPKSQFGYLASSLTLSERHDAQQAITDYVKDSRLRGFPIDAMHLSSGYCQDAETGERNFFTWDPQKYPDPSSLGRTLEHELRCQVIINVKPWLLESHPFYTRTALAGAFIRAAPDARPARSGGPPQDPDRCTASPSGNARTLHWSTSMGQTGKGSYFDFSSVKGCHEWQKLMVDGILSNNITGLWIDNNEFSTLMDDDEELQGEIEMWSLPMLSSAIVGPAGSTSSTGLSLQGFSSSEEGQEVIERAGWGQKRISVGAVGRGSLTMGMARATYEALCRHRPNRRPVIVTRSSVPGMQAFAHASWSGDNSTSWLSLKWSTKMTLSFGLSFGQGLYGHDIGGFAGSHSPSAELLIRWCQQSLWHTRFTVHSWKQISTTLWMYDHIPGVTDILRGILHLRYRLIPMLYSLFVNDYHRKAWPVLKPLLWFHSLDFITLTQDEQFIAGSHVLVAPVTTFGARSITFNLPATVDNGQENKAAWWCHQETGDWIEPQVTTRQVTLEAPLSSIPTLVRDGGIIVLGEPCNEHACNPLQSSPQVRKRLVQIFPRPQAPSSGSFSLIEDDGISNEATARGAFSEILITFETVAEQDDIVKVDIEAIRKGYQGKWSFQFELPQHDKRRILVQGCNDGTNATALLQVTATDVESSAGG